MKLKLDLHTHCHEATGLRPLGVEVVGRIIAQVKSRGMDGLAVTDHWDPDYGFQVKEIVEKEFDNEIIVIPGQELYVGMRHIAELYLDGNEGKKVFRILAHPGSPYHPAIPECFPHPSTLDNIQGIEIENGMNGDCINKELVQQIAEQYNLLILRNSDAHYLHRVGEFYNEIELDELYSRAVLNGHITRI